MSSHDNFVSVGINMALAQRNRLRKHIIARTNKVNKEHLVVPHQTEDSLVVVSSALWAECYDDALGSVCLHNSLSH